MLFFENKYILFLFLLNVISCKEFKTSSMPISLRIGPTAVYIGHLQMCLVLSRYVKLDYTHLLSPK